MSWIKKIILLTCVVSGMGLQCTLFNDVLDKTFQCKGFYLKNYSCEFQFQHRDVYVFVEYDNAKHFLTCSNSENISTFQDPIQCNMSNYDYEDLLAENIDKFNFRIFDERSNVTYCRAVLHYQTVILPVFKVKEIAKTDRDVEFQLYYDEIGQYFNSIDFIPYNVTYFCEDDLCEPKDLLTRKLRFSIGKLPYAYFEYEIHLNVSIENCSNWTEQLIRITTNSRIPDHVPVFKDYYFAVNEARKQITIYWQALERKYRNGPSFYYRVSVRRGDVILTTFDESDNQAIIDLNPYGNYTFTLQSCNKKGCSSNETSIYYHKSKDNYKFCAWTTFEENRFRVHWYAANEKEPPLNFIVAFYDENSIKLINFIEDINAETNYYEVTSSRNPTFGIVANYRDFSTGIVWNFCKSEAKNGFRTPEIIVFKKSSTELRILFQKFDCTLKAAASFYEITYCNDESCLLRNVTNKDLRTDEFILSELKPFTNYKVSLRIFNNFVGYGRTSNVALCRTGEGISSAPLNLQITNQTSSTLSLTWEHPKFINGEVQSYILHFKNSIPSIMIPANLTSYIVRSLNCSSSYNIRINLITKFFEGLASNEVEGTTDVIAPARPELNEISYEGNNVILQWRKSDCLSPSNSFYVLSIGNRQSIIPSERCTLTQPICENNVSAVMTLFAVNRMSENKSNSNCRVFADSDQLCQENDLDLLLGPQYFLCSEELVTELKCSSLKYLMMLYIGIPVCFIMLSIICIFVAKKIMAMRDIKCIPPKGLIEMNENGNEEMYNLMSVRH